MFLPDNAHMGLTVLGVRHGEVYNPKNVIYSGLPGYGLSDRGRAQAKAVADALAGVEVAALYASPLERAVETAEFIAEATGAELRTDERLYEWRHWGQWAGMTWDELRTKGREAWDLYTKDPGAVTAGESLAELAARVDSWLQEASAARSAEEGGLVIAVSHLEPLRAILLDKLSRPAKDLFAIEIGHCGIVQVAPEPSADPISLSELAKWGVN